MTKNQMDKVILSIAGFWKSFQPTDEEIDFWYQELECRNYNGIMACVNKYKLSSKFPPHISEILSAYEDGVKKMNAEIRWQWSNNILPSLSDINHKETVDECQKLYLDFMDNIPLVNKATIANRLGKSLYAYAKTLGKKEFNFSEWLKEIANEL